MSAATPAGAQPYYFVPAPSRHPASAAFGLLLVIFGASQWINGARLGRLGRCSPASCVWLFVLQHGSAQAIGESEGGHYNKRVDVSFRWSMSWFIFSEVMFFGAFFGALYWARVHSLPDARQTSTTRCCGPTSRRSGRAPRPATPARRPASSSRSRRWARGRSRRSTPRSC